MQDFLFKLYDYNISSLLENDKKRDQVIAVYTGIVGLYFSFGIKELRSLVEQSFYMQWIVLVIMFLINMITMVLLLRYRRFHMQCNIGIQVMQRFIANYLKMSEKEIQNVSRIPFWLQRQLNEYFLSIYRYPFSRKPTNYDKYHRGKFLEKEKCWVSVKRIWKFFTGVENMMFAFFAMISSLSLGVTAAVLFDVNAGILSVITQLLLDFWLYWRSLHEDKWLAHPQKNEYNKWDQMYHGLSSVTIMLDVRGLANENNRKPILKS